MKRFLGLAFTVTLAASPLVSAQPRPATPRVEAPVALQQPDPTPAPSLCCCRVWTHGWQYSWRDTATCTTANGTCVSPDHC